VKTYKVSIEKPMLEIRYDEDATNPREDTDMNIGYFVTIEKRHISPDDNEVLINIVKETSEESSNSKEHMEKICFLIEERLKEKVVYIKPVTRYEHSGIDYMLGEYHGFDYSVCGFYIVTDKTLENCGAKIDEVERIIKGELDTYNMWANGYVYYFTLYDKDGNIEDNMGGFYNINEIRGHLPDDWKEENLQDYFVQA